MAHAYSTDSAERQRIPFFIAASAIGAAFLLPRVMLVFSVEVPWWAPPVDTMAFYGLFYWLFDRHIWKWKWIRKLKIVECPDLSGIWVGRIIPTQTSGASAGLSAETEITLIIHQTWTRFLIQGETHHSRSRSVSATLRIEDGVVLSYEYINEPTPAAAPTMHAHRGLTKIAVDNLKGELEGDYFSGRDRQSFGIIRATRQGK